MFPMDYICRVCSKDGCIPLLDKIEDEYDIMCAIRNICNIQISIEDKLPKHICVDCLNLLKTAVKFRTLCRKTDNQFRSVTNSESATGNSYCSKYDFNLLLHKINLKRLKNSETMQKKRTKLHSFANKRAKMKHFKCSPCQLEFNTQDDLKSHKQQKQCLKSTCEICGEQVLDVAQHKLKHGDSIHRCDTCGKEFPLLSRLKSHMLVHSDEFNFFCDLCPYKSKQKHNLVLHMRTHTGEKPYTCDQCSAAFVNQSNYSKHMKRHGDKQYMCPTCNKCFVMKNDCQEHYNAVHLNIKHHCDECGREFSYRNDLRKHQVRVHNYAKKDYKGGEPSYLQYERKRYDETNKQTEQTQPETVSHQSMQVEPLHGTYMSNKNYVYYSEVPVVFHSGGNVAASQAMHIISEQPLQAVKKDDHKIYEQQPEVTYFMH